MNQYTRNREIMAHALAQELAGKVVLSDDDSLNVFNLPDSIQAEIAKKLRAEYRNEVEIDPLMVRTIGLEQSYDKALLREFDNHMSYDCEEWMRTFKREDAA